MRGTRAVRQAVLDEFPEADLAVQVVWVDMFPMDGRGAIDRTAEILGSDSRLEHFYDSDNDSGAALSKRLGWEDRAWDIYLFYAPGVTWEGEVPPEADAFFHQLPAHGGTEHFSTGKDLVASLRHAMQELTAP